MDDSKAPELTVDREFRSLIRPLLKDEYAMSYPLSLHTMNWFSSIWMDRIVLSTTTRMCLHKRTPKAL